MMSEKNNTQQELQENCPGIADISRNNVYALPLNYFDDLAANIVAQVKGGNAGSLLSAASTPAPFSVPTGYFDNLSSQILAKVQTQGAENEVRKELVEIAPLLNTISREMMYTVPVNYFDTFKVDNTEERAALAPIRTISRVTRIMRYSMAAAVTGILAVGGYFIATGDRANTGGEQILSSINISTAVDKLSNAEIVDYLDNNTLGFDVSATLSGTDEEFNINDFIKNLTDDEIREYLKDKEEPTGKKTKDS